MSTTETPARTASQTVDADALRSFVAAVLQKVGMGEEAAEGAAEVFVDAELRGVRSHGVSHLPGRARDLAAGKLNAAAVPTLVRRVGSTALYDGHRGFGPALCALVIRHAVELAAEGGIGMAMIRDSAHWLCPAYYSRWMAHEGFIALSMTNTNPGMPMWGAAAKSVTNSPIAIAAPRRAHEPVVLDMSLQRISWSGMKLYAEAGEKLPGPWGYDEAGNETDDPVVIARTGRVKPIGDYKGSGFAFMQEILTGVLGAGMISAQIGAHTQQGEIGHYSQTFIAIRPDLFQTLDEYYDRMELLCHEARNAPLAEGFAEISLPGDHSNAVLAERGHNGIPLDHLRETLAELSATYDLPPPWA